MRAAEVIYAVTHPIQATKALVRQTAVGMEHAAPPPGTTIEEFPKMSLYEAMQVLFPPPDDNPPHLEWSKTDEKRMANGELPQGHPLHRDL